MIVWDSARVVTFSLRLRQSQKPLIFRLIHLHHASTTKHVTGNHRIKEYKNFDYPDPKDFELELWDTKPLRKNTDISLSETLRRFIKPGRALIPLESKLECRLPESDKPRYCIGELNTEKVYKTKPGKGKGRGSREFHFKVDVDSGHFAHAMYKSYHILSRNACRSPIELHIHYPMKKTKIIPGFSAEVLKNRQDQIDEHQRLFVKSIHEALHLWPEIILKAMPEGSNITISPVANKDDVCWVMDLGGKDKNKLFQTNRNLHQNLYEEGKGLPDKETRRRVKIDLREARNVIRAEIEAQEKEEAKREQMQLKKNLIRVARDGEPEMSQKSGSTSRRSSLHSLVSQITLGDIVRSSDIPALNELKFFVKDKLMRKGTVGLMWECQYEGLEDIDRRKIYFIALLQVKDRVSVLQHEQIHGTEKVQKENKAILERVKDYYKDQPDARQLDEEVKRRLEADLAKAKRRNEDKIKIEMRKMTRRRQKLIENLGPAEKRELLAFEGTWTRTMYQSAKKPKAGYNWQTSRGSSSA